MAKCQLQKCVCVKMKKIDTNIQYIGGGSNKHIMLGFLHNLKMLVRTDFYNQLLNGDLTLLQLCIIYDEPKSIQRSKTFSLLQLLNPVENIINNCKTKRNNSFYGFYNQHKIKKYHL